MAGIYSNANGVSTAPLTGINEIDSLIGTNGNKWGGGPGTPVTITYSFPTYTSLFQPGYSSLFENYTFTPFSEATKALARVALGKWANYANIQFVEVPDDANGAGDIRMAFDDYGSGEGHTYLPSTNPHAGDVWLTTSRYSDFQDPNTRGYGLLSMMHEIGHALGLKHPGNYNVSGGTIPGPYLPYDQDYYRNSIMSYNEYPGSYYASKASINGYPTTPMVYDVEAIQYLYGKSTTPLQNYTFNGTNPGFAVIDNAISQVTIDASGSTGNDTINLTPGTWSGIKDYVRASNGLIFGGVYITQGTVVGKLILGSGIDTVTGSSTGDTIVAGTGSETIDGGLGSDQVVINKPFSAVTATRTNANTLVIDEHSAKLTLSNVEKLVFTDGTQSGATLGLTSALAPQVATVDTVTSAQASAKATIYSGPVDYLQFEYHNLGSNNVIINSPGSNIWLTGGPGDDSITGGAGQNIIDGGAGSNFLTGNVGGGTTDFYITLPGQKSPITWNTITDFHAGDAVTVWGWQNGVSTYYWDGIAGAPGHTGATLRASLGGDSVINASITFGGLTVEQEAQVHIVAGVVGGNSYLLFTM